MALENALRDLALRMKTTGKEFSDIKTAEKKQSALEALTQQQAQQKRAIIAANPDLANLAAAPLSNVASAASTLATREKKQRSLEQVAQDAAVKRRLGQPTTPEEDAAINVLNTKRQTFTADDLGNLRPTKLPIGTPGQQATAPQQTAPGTDSPAVKFEQQKARVKADESRRNAFISEIQKKGDTALAITDSIGIMQNSLANIEETGLLSPMKSAAFNLAKSAGIDINIEGITDLEQLRSELDAITIPTVKELGSRPTDFDFKKAQSAISKITDLKASIIARLDQKQQISQRNMLASRAITDAAEVGASAKELRKIGADIKKNNPLLVSEVAPEDGNFVVGTRYIIPSKGIVATWNGKEFEF